MKMKEMQPIPYKQSDYNSFFKKQPNRTKHRKYRYHQLGMKNNLIKVWESLSEIKNNSNFHPSNVSSVCNGNRKTHKGYKWIKVKIVKKEKP